MLTNEEIVAEIQAGRADLYGELWARTERFIVLQAKRWFYLTGGLGGTTVDDLTQSGYLALVKAVEGFDAERGIKFLSFLGPTLRNAFLDACGLRSSKRDPLLTSLSLDAPLDDDPDASTLLDLQADPADLEQTAIDHVYRAQLRRALDDALDGLPTTEKQIINGLYFDGKTSAQLAAELGIAVERVPALRVAAFRKLQKKLELKKFLDDQTNFFAGAGLAAFRRSHTSGPERLTIRRDRLARQYGGYYD